MRSSTVEPERDATATTAPVPWYRTITREQWRVLAAAKFGWMLDAMDFMLYAMALNQLRSYFGFNDATAGLLGTVTLVMSGVGGLIFGYVADRFGRTRALMGTIAIFSLASLGAATSQSVMQLLFWRALLGIGMGGEWASGAVLVSETWPPEHRNKAISIMQSGWALGYILAALAAAADPRRRRRSADDSWRWLFVVGVLPAFFTLWIRRYVQEPESVDGGPRRRTDAGPNPFRGDLRPRAARAHAADHPARRRRCSSPTGASSSGCRRSWPRPVAAGRRRHGRRRLARLDDPGADRRVRSAT